MIHRVGHTPEEEKQMLEAMGDESFDALMEQVPAGQRLKDTLDLPRPLSEAELRREFEILSRLNYDPPVTPSFLGAGVYDHDRPAAVTAGHDNRLVATQSVDGLPRVRIHGLNIGQET